jgi:hypothetical protein
LKEVKSKPISVEVFSDDFPEMRRQALKMHDWLSAATASSPQRQNPPLPFLEFFDQSGLARNRSTPAKHCEVQGHIAILLE